jgi:uncharacterized protein YjiS (DUF1127 family)
MREAASFIAAQSVRRPFSLRALVSRVAAPLRWYVRRREITVLADLDDHLLADLGLERHDIRWALQLPLTDNAALELQRRALRRRRVA